MIYILDENYIGFPDPHKGEKDGWLAIGGDLTPDRLWLAYHNGIFPWYAYKQKLDDQIPSLKGKPQIQWYCPLKRFVIYPQEIHISHSMRTLINKQTYHATTNKNFDAVIRHCAQADNRDQDPYAWLGDDMIKAYKTLHQQGRAISIEIWDQQEQLAGGLYGVLTKNIFCGESMFSLQPNTSKIALIHLSQTLIKNNVKLIDCQFETQHLKSMGGRTISYEKYIDIMRGTDTTDQ